MRKRVLALVGAGVGLVVAVGAGAGYVAHFHDRGLPRTTVAGQSIAGQTRAQVASSLRERAKAVTVTWTSKGVTHKASLADLGYSVDVDATVSKAFARSSSWTGELGALVSGRDVEAVVRSDTATLDATVQAIVADAGVGGADAQVGLAADGGSFQVTPEVEGSTVSPASFQRVVARAATGLEDRTTTITFAHVPPKVSTAAAQQAADAANALVALPVVVSDGKKDHSPTPAEHAAWVSVPVTGKGLGTPTLDLNQVTAWVQQVADAASTDPVTGQRYVGPDGSVISVTKKAVDGREVTNVDTVAKAITDAAGSGKDATATFDYTPVPAVWDSRTVSSAADVLAYFPTGNEKWIDVNLANHTVTAYEGTTVVMGPFAMVDGATATPTVVGTFSIYAKYTSKTMRGFEADGVTPYTTENVPWVMFFHSGFALHGAPWRSSFGYAGARGSHGCVNLPVPTAKKLYDWAAVGTVVVTHR